MIVSLIVAHGRDREIGKDNDLLWHLPKDMRFFTQTTKGHYVIMGRKNWDSIPLKYRPLPGRPNVVVTRRNDLKIDEADVVSSIEEGIALAKENGEEEAFVIGGGQIYRLALEKGLIDKMYITYVDANFDADTFFPEIDFSEWDLSSEEFSEVDEKNPFAFRIYTYMKKG